MAKGSQDPTVSTYYVGMHMILCNAPIDSVSRIEVSEKLVYGNLIPSSSSIFINQYDIFGGEVGEGGIKGTVDFAFGLPDQQVNSYLAAKIEENIPAYRGIVSAILNQVYLGTNYYMKSWRFFTTRIYKKEKGQGQWLPAYAEPLNTISPQTLERTRIASSTENFNRPPEQLGLQVGVLDGNAPLRFPIWKGYVLKIENPNSSYNNTYWEVVSEDVSGGLNSNDQETLDISSNFVLYKLGGNINAVHILRECLTDGEWGLNVPEILIDIDSWESAAQTCFSEGLCFSFLWYKDSSLLEFMDDVRKHIQAVVYKDRVSGLWKIKLLRKEVVTSNHLVINDKSLQTIKTFSRKALLDLTNQVIIHYESNNTFASATYRTSNSSLYARQGKVVVSEITYSGVSTAEVAQILGNRDLWQLGLPIYSGTLICNRTAENLNPGDLFVLQTETLLDNTPTYLRVKSINLGTAEEEAITIEFVEDFFQAYEIFNFETAGQKWVSPISLPRNITRKITQEIPYYFVARKKGDAYAKGVSTLETGILVSAESPTGDSYSSELWVAEPTNYTRRGTVDFCYVSPITNGINRINTQITVTSIEDIDQLSIGNVALLGDEIIGILAISGHLITIARGCLDTIPENHLASTLLFGFQDYYGVADITYFVGEILKTKLLTKTPRGILGLNQSTEQVITLIGRMHRPYPPANVKVNNAYFPSTFTTDTLTLSWSTRNRFQQTIGFTDFFTGGITPESNLQYKLVFTDTSTEEIFYVIYYILGEEGTPEGTLFETPIPEVITVRSYALFAPLTTEITVSFPLINIESALPTGIFPSLFSLSLYTLNVNGSSLPVVIPFTNSGLELTYLTDLNGDFLTDSDTILLTEN